MIKKKMKVSVTTIRAELDKSMAEGNMSSYGRLHVGTY